jgi:glycosyltransferase involved in cell wall biosynthesis
MFAPWHARCGIRDYTAHLIQALDDLPEIGCTRIVAAPPDAARHGLRDAVAHYAADRARFRELGRAMNTAAEVAHVQHQYFLFGGVSPAKSHVRTFLNELTVPAVMTVHEIAEPPDGFVNHAAVAAANRINFLHPAIKALIVHTEADRERLIGIGAREPHVHVIRHPVPRALPTPEHDLARTAFETRHPETAGRKIVTLFGFLSAKKGHAVALSALARMDPDTVLVFGGGPHPDDHTDYTPELHAIADRLGIQGRVIFTGYLTEERVAELMAITDVAIAPFLRSSGSGSLANLLAYGRPIVASDIAPHRELLASAPSLFTLAPAGDAQGLADAVAALLGDTARRQELRRAALAYAERHSYREMARETVAVYERVRG